MATHDNAPAPDGWRPFARHCGEICFDRTCPICLETLPPRPSLRGSARALGISNDSTEFDALTGRRLSDQD